MASVNFSAKDISHITKFDGKNFSFWKSRINLVLESYELLDVVDGSEVKPTPIVILADNSNAAIVTARATIIKQWKKHDVTARNLILSSLDDKCQLTVIGCPTANQMWNRLKSQFELTSKENSHMLLESFMSYKYESGHDVMRHISTIEALARQLNEIGSPISEGLIMTKIIMTLPSNYRSFLSAWNNCDEKNKTLKLLEVRLLAEENMDKMAGLNVSGQDDAALWAANRKSKWQPTTEPKGHHNGAKGGSGDTRKPQCGFCTKLNHRSSHHEDSCWRKEMYEKGKRDANGETALAAESVQKKKPVPKEVSKKKFYDGDYAYRSTIFDCDDDEWYVDSGATQHMTDQRSVFNSFKPIPPGTRAIKGIGKDNLPVFALGIGDIRVRTRVDGVWHDGIIQDALFAPNLGGSLFSLSAATERGVKAIFEDSHVTLMKNHKTIATASRVSQKLYLMDMESIPPRN
jgi:hypothetical protein